MKTVKKITGISLAAAAATLLLAGCSSAEDVALGGCPRIGVVARES